MWMVYIGVTLKVGEEGNHDKICGRGVSLVLSERPEIASGAVPVSL